MATTKTLTPTNETITIDAFQDEKPDYRHVADAEGKLADAVNALNGKTVRFWEGSVTTDSNGRFNANSTINVAGSSKPVILGITCYEAWYHFRLYHGSNYNTMVQVTDYDVNTPKPNVTLTIRIAYAY